jgi:hypothetical protein
MKPIYVLALMLSAGVVLTAETGCKKITQSVTEKAIEEGTGAKSVDLDKGKMQVEGPNGQKMAMGENVALPDGWPKDRVPPYPGAKINAAVSANGSLSYIAETPDSPDKVKTFYKSKLSSYKEEGVFTTPQSVTAAYKSSAESVSFSASSAGDGKTMITITIAPNK